MVLGEPEPAGATAAEDSGAADASGNVSSGGGAEELGRNTRRPPTTAATTATPAMATRAGDTSTPARWTSDSTRSRQPGSGVGRRGVPIGVDGSDMDPPGLGRVDRKGRRGRVAGYLAGPSTDARRARHSASTSNGMRRYAPQWGYQRARHRR